VSARKGLWALAGTAVTVGLGLTAQRSWVNARRRNDPEAAEAFGSRRGERSRFVELVDGGRLFVEEVGPESPHGAVFVHGSALRTDVWHYQLAGIGGHRLVFYDLRGHGRSQPKGDAEFSVKTMAGDLKAVIEDSRLERVVVVGHSVGGMIALQLCADEPDFARSHVAGLVLAHTTYRPAFETVLGGAVLSRLERLVRRPLDVLGSQAHRLENLRRIVRPSDTVFLVVSLAAFGPHPSARQVDFVYDMLAETPTDVLFDLVRSYRDFDVSEALEQVEVPALVIGGSHDRITLPGASEHLATHLPDAHLEMMQACGHISMLERHERFSALVAGFLDEHLGRPTTFAPALEEGAR
jgi:pimeloyl-ACP methyl ester carboxylesterase